MQIKDLRKMLSFPPASRNRLPCAIGRRNPSLPELPSVQKKHNTLRTTAA